MIRRLLLVLAFALAIVAGALSGRLIILQLGEDAPDTTEVLPCLFSTQPCSP